MPKTFVFAFLGALSVALVADAAGPKATAAPTGSKSLKLKPKAGKGAARSGWKYVAVSPALFRATKHRRKSKITGAHAVLYEGRATVHLPDGARLREFGCWAAWEGSAGAKVHITSQEHHSASGLILGTLENAARGGGRLDVALDHVVTNHSHSYNVWVRAFAGQVLRGCRIAYTPAPN